MKCGKSEHFAYTYSTCLISWAKVTAWFKICIRCTHEKEPFRIKIDAIPKRDLLNRNCIDESIYWLASIKCGITYYMFNLACKDYKANFFYH